MPVEFKDYYTTLGVPREASNADIKVRIPAGTNNRQELRVGGQGLPKGKSGTRGDLYVVMEVELPPKVTEEERRLWEKLRDVSYFNPRQGAW
jgi:curved DNA-binding protein